MELADRVVVTATARAGWALCSRIAAFAAAAGRCGVRWASGLGLGASPVRTPVRVVHTGLGEPQYHEHSHCVSPHLAVFDVVGHIQRLVAHTIYCCSHCYRVHQCSCCHIRHNTDGIAVRLGVLARLGCRRWVGRLGGSLGCRRVWVVLDPANSMVGGEAGRPSAGRRP